MALHIMLNTITLPSPSHAHHPIMVIITLQSLSHAHCHMLTVTLLSLSHAHCHIVVIVTCSLSHYGHCHMLTVTLRSLSHAHCHITVNVTLRSLSHAHCHITVIVTCSLSHYCHCHMLTVTLRSPSHYSCAHYDTVTLWLCSPSHYDALTLLLPDQDIRGADIQHRDYEVLKAVRGWDHPRQPPVSPARRLVSSARDSYCRSIRSTSVPAATQTETARGWRSGTSSCLNAQSLIVCYRKLYSIYIVTSWLIVCYRNLYSINIVTSWLLKGVLKNHFKKIIFIVICIWISSLLVNMQCKHDVPSRIIQIK